MSTRLKLITETSWLVIGDTDDNRIGLLSEIQNQYVLMVKGEKQKFISRKEVNDFFEEDIFNNIIEPVLAIKEKKDYFINGYPVDYDNPHEVIIKGNALPLYSKNATSETVFAAGYYCLGFKRNWMPALCPKLSTLNTYSYSGPFKTELEMKISLAACRKEMHK